ncbi:hypothetical protein [Streptomyces sp. NBC_00847]|uniref:hypothetical protein n=1 Tax=Streptomyces sp. NBC_00847 TaxID=2975850 RepID=UPI00225E2C74|nr:hypothetical protein [Streptomyces sp. NBC_00847]MCX4886071.1 hypothetical protein [Streptomyces sp. NBC_00847]
MDTRVSSNAWRIARFWADGHDRSEAAINGYARQVQDHLDHNGDPDYFHRLAGWMSLDQPACLDIDLAMRLRGAPRPELTAHSGHPCLCRGGSARHGGAPVPEAVRQLIHRPSLARAA